MFVRHRLVPQLRALFERGIAQVLLFVGALLWLLPQERFAGATLFLLNYINMKLGSFLLLHSVRFSIRHLSRRYLTDHWELLPNLDSPQHSLLHSFSPVLVRIPKCGNGESADANKRLPPLRLFSFVRSQASWVKKKSRH